MTTVFDTLSERFYAAYFEPDTKKRRKAIERWIDKSVPVIQKAIKTDLQSYLEQILETRWTTQGWQSGVKKFIRIMENYRLIMNIQITDTKNMKSTRKVDPVSSGDRAKTLRLAEMSLSEFDPEGAKVHIKRTETVASGHSGDSGSDDDYEDSGRTPNDDRSDSMNPNNDAYQASMDNRSDQMNPNNDAYWSSRGR